MEFSEIPAPDSGAARAPRESVSICIPFWDRLMQEARNTSRGDTMAGATNNDNDEDPVVDTTEWTHYPGEGGVRAAHDADDGETLAALEEKITCEGNPLKESQILAKRKTVPRGRGPGIYFRRPSLPKVNPRKMEKMPAEGVMSLDEDDVDTGRPAHNGAGDPYDQDSMVHDSKG